MAVSRDKTIRLLLRDSGGRINYYSAVAGGGPKVGENWFWAGVGVNRSKVPKEWGHAEEERDFVEWKMKTEDLFPSMSFSSSLLRTFVEEVLVCAGAKRREFLSLFL